MDISLIALTSSHCLVQNNENFYEESYSFSSLAFLKRKELHRICSHSSQELLASWPSSFCPYNLPLLAGRRERPGYLPVS